MISTDDLLPDVDVEAMRRSVETDPGSRAWAHINRFAEHFGVLAGGGSGGGGGNERERKPLRRRRR